MGRELKGLRATIKVKTRPDEDDIILSTLGKEKWRNYRNKRENEESSKQS